MMLLVKKPRSSLQLFFVMFTRIKNKCSVKVSVFRRYVSQFNVMDQIWAFQHVNAYVAHITHHTHRMGTQQITSLLKGSTLCRYNFENNSTEKNRALCWNNSASFLGTFVSYKTYRPVYHLLRTPGYKYNTFSSSSSTTLSTSSLFNSHVGKILQKVQFYFSL